MFDANVRNNQSISFNSVAGTIVKSCEESRFVRFHMNSELAERIFSTTKPKISSDWNAQEIVVLQVMLCGGDQFLVEYMYKDDAPATK
jgi:hypothetical protein